MSVHYKFKSSPERFTVIFDGLHISVADLKKEIMKQRKIGKSADLDLQIINSQTKEVYTSDNELIPKNTSVEVARVPVAGVRKNRERIDTNAIKGANSPSHIEVEKITKSSNISTSYATEDEKIKAMMTQSTQDYDTSKYAKNRGPIGPLPPNYTCYRCGNPGHYIKQCPTNNTDVKRSTGIPRSFMIPANADQKGALLTASGEYAVPIIDHQAYKEVKKEKPPFVATLESEKQEVMTEIPDDIKCLLCGDLLQDAVLIPCCGNSFCDECIRNRLLESETHECPECHETQQSPDSLIPNRFLRNSVSKFRNDTGYSGTKTWSETLNNLTKPVANEQTKPEPLPLNDVKLNDVSNSPKPVDNELKSQSPQETAVESPIIETNGPSDVTMDEVLLESTQKDQKSEENVLNGQISGLSDELLGSQSSNDTKEVNETKTEGQDSTIGSDNQIIGEQLESYESIIDPNSVTIEGNPVMSLAQYPTQHMIPGYPRPPRMMSNMGPIRTIRTTVGQQPNPAMIGRPPPTMMPHPRGGVYPRTAMPSGYRQMTDPRGFPMGMPHNMAPYGYPPQMRPNAYHDPYGYMGPRSHMTAGAMHPMAMAGMGEAPPPGSAPIMADPHYQYTKPEYDDYEDRFNRFTRQLESRSRGRPKRNRSISRTRSRTRSPINRMSRSRSSSTSSSTSSSSSSSSFSFSSRSRSFSPRRRSRSRSHYRNRRSRSPSPRYGRGYGRDYRYRRSRSPVRGSDSRRYPDRTRDRYEREKDPKYKDSRHNDRNDSSHRSSHRSDDKKKESKQTHSKNSSKAQDKSRDSDKSKKKKSHSKTPTKDEDNDNKSSEVEVKTETIENKEKNEVKPENDSNKTHDNNKSSDKSKRRKSRSSTPTKDEVNDKCSEEVLKTESNENKDKTETKVENESKSDDKNRSSDKSKRKKTRTKSPQKENSSDKNSEAVLKTVTKTVTNESKDKSDVKVENESNKSDKKSSDKSRSKRNRSKSPPKDESNNNKSNEVVVKSEPKEEKRDKSDHKSEKESKKSKSNDNKSESKDKNKEKPEKEKSDENPDRSSGKDKKKSKDKSKKHHKHHHKHHHHKHRKSSDDKDVKDSKESKEKKDDSKSSSSKRSSKKSSSSSALKSVVS